MPLKEETPRQSQRSSAGIKSLPNGSFKSYSRNSSSQLKFCQQFYRIAVSWESVFSRIGEKAPRRGRARCPLHNGDSDQSLSVNEKGGVFFCHVCHAGGDKIGFVRQLYGYTFAEALAWFGLSRNEIPKLDPEILRRDHVRSARQGFCRFHARRVGKILFNLNMALSGAEKRLAVDAEDSNAWLALEIFHRLYEHYERLHDLLLSRHEHEQTEAYRKVMRCAA